MWAHTYLSKSTNGRRGSGFTIVELLIVVVVIAILAAITIVSYSGITNRSKQSSAQTAAAQAAKKISLWGVENAGQSPDQATFNGFMGANASQYQYSPGVDGAFCVTATTQNVSYYSSRNDASAVAGACPGHGVDGASVAINYAINPRFIGSSGPLDYSNTASHQIVDVGGTRYAQGAATAAAASSIRLFAFDERWAVSEGQQVYGRVTVRNGNSVSRTFQIAVRYYDTAGINEGNFISSTLSSTVSIAAGATANFSVSSTAPAGAASVGIAVVRNSTGAIGDVIQATNVWLSDTNAPFADGATAGWVWRGVPNDSISSGPSP